MKFDTIRKFYESWGLFPGNQSFEKSEINAQCYAKLMDEATTLYGKEFANFVSKFIDATDDIFYLSAVSWEDLEEAASLLGILNVGE